jgi:hypothetical protein
MIIDVVKIAVAVANFSPPGRLKIPKLEQSAYMTSEATMIPRMPIPEIGLEDVPTRPAIYAQAAATKNPMSTATTTPTTTKVRFCDIGSSSGLTKA